jgi:hypothetical protein
MAVNATTMQPHDDPASINRHLRDLFVVYARHAAWVPNSNLVRMRLFGPDKRMALLTRDIAGTLTVEVPGGNFVSLPERLVFAPTTGGVRRASLRDLWPHLQEAWPIPVAGARYAIVENDQITAMVEASIDPYANGFVIYVPAGDNPPSHLRDLSPDIFWAMLEIGWLKDVTKRLANLNPPVWRVTSVAEPPGWAFETTVQSRWGRHAHLRGNVAYGAYPTGATTTLVYPLAHFNNLLLTSYREHGYQVRNHSETLQLVARQRFRP